MQLTWSHAVLNVRDLNSMLDFYTQVLGFTIEDRGPLAPNADTEIVFLSQFADEHHQLAMMNSRRDEEPANSLNHMAFRTAEYEDIQTLHAKLAETEGVNILPLSHGNTLSLYFNDPEGNGIEVFWDTPWHVDQPQGKPWDVSLEKDAALQWVEANFSDEPSFEPQEDYYARRRSN